ncbi:helix-turn-helix transcriptional regulator [Amycolatopsis sp. 195334CR]|uniref:ArsR/SmtB family transcription factor n=1 Tax=Amycolatopsis sp. 195334CR TaxID=2814588 RepID=UPI001A90B40E|nr:helix-turn-helix domain-containing protein [Amycolatopsis sp. 195334CR]MBN6041812.1 helix-turn-helix transcriptional regulator [Amycolatopsis sp. 195334CR]
MSAELSERVAELERRVAALEGRAEPEPPPEDDGGVITYAGELTRPGELRWQVALPSSRVLALADQPRIEVLSALAHPARAAIVRHLAEHGAQPGATLQEAAELGSAGQFYHHLKALTGAGIVEQDKRGSYRLRATAAIPALVLLAAAADIAGQLR